MISMRIYFFVPYGRWFGGARLMPSSDAFFWTAAGVLPILNPITRVGVLPLA